MNSIRNTPSFTTWIAPFIAAITLAATPTAARADWNWGWVKRVTGSGVSKTETRHPGSFNGVSLGLSAKVEVKQGNNESITITGDDNIVPLIETEIENGKLKIRWTERNLSVNYKNLVILVEAKDIESLSIAGSGDIVADTLNAKEFKVSVAGSGGVRIKQLNAGEVTASISGSGDIHLAGRAQSIKTKIAGSGDIKAGNLETKSASVSIAGSGNVALWTTDTLSVSVAGSGDVRYYGDPNVSQKVAGSGSVKRMGKAP
jgi:hypothetical protein